ncbi:MAG: YihA family ribosome biogenesis GTP-binding protein [Ignavibacteriales bacterium]|jgi:GTP-binding protein|nr:ribosome biogenesis GTP-binding protein YihA/YsxC [Ignavibacteriaceae bacterium]NLH62126.1 YihA family ribosome biogenesis GTP-binding protein [Ignavibacteriales bacterium]HOJ17826.1 ribosome biogenesis GTP-binding protein YihA/YsxC [Ignavibacteriaceae bacterium]HPO55027.1 ribosome biogenesis GTP-binding protein YihA/YsxC [Ignavibacteriaceae bacterium]
MEKVNFVKSVFDLNSLPKLILPEVILAGRSNVGKSTFINSFVKKKIAMTSSTPGKTRSINYYIVSERYYIVDLPGFGYSKAGKEITEKWKDLLKNFFTHERGKRLILHIIDSRHEPTILDEVFRDLADNFNYKYVVVLNKTDKLRRGEYTNALRNIVKFKEGLELNRNLFPYSSLTSDGKRGIASLIKEFIK